MKAKIRIGVIPAAGVGNRISELPLTRILPKPMLPVLNKPILEYVIQHMKDVGVELIYLIVGFKRKVIQEYFKDGSDFGVKIKYVVNKAPEKTGIADTILLTQKYIKEPFIVILGDDFTTTKTLMPFVKKFFDKDALVVEAVVPENDLSSLRRTNSVMIEKNGRILKIIEKPKRPKFKVRGCGLYIFNPSIFEFIKKTLPSHYRPGRDITNTIQLVANKGKAYGFFIDGDNVNINTLSDLKAAMNQVLKKPSLI